MLSEDKLLQMSRGFSAFMYRPVGSVVEWQHSITEANYCAGEISSVRNPSSTLSIQPPTPVQHTDRACPRRHRGYAPAYYSIHTQHAPLHLSNNTTQTKLNPPSHSQETGMATRGVWGQAVFSSTSIVSLAKGCKISGTMLANYIRQLYTVRQPPKNSPTLPPHTGED